MRKFKRVAVIGILLWMGSVLPTLVEPGDPPAGSPPAPFWTYRWTESPGGMTQVWRRPTAGGDSDWILVGSIPEQVLQVMATAADPDLVVARAGQALYRSRDAGQVWEELSNLPDWPTALALGQHTPGLLYLGTLTGGVFRSIDGGNTWRALSSDGLGLLPGAFLETTALAVHPQDDEIVYAATGYWLGTPTCSSRLTASLSAWMQAAPGCRCTWQALTSPGDPA